MPPKGYGRKLKEFIRMCAEAKLGGGEVVIVHHSEVLGDTYAEMVESLNWLAQAELMLVIVPPSLRCKG